MLVGGAGGWAWEAPGVSRRAALPQHLQGLNSVGSCCPVGAPLELTHTCAAALCTRKHYALFLSLSGSNTQACTPIFKHSLTVPKKANTHKPTCTNPPGLCTPLLRLRATHEHTHTHISVLWCTTARSLTHTEVHVPQESHTQRQTHPCVLLCLLLVAQSCPTLCRPHGL